MVLFSVSAPASQPSGCQLLTTLFLHPSWAQQEDFCAIMKQNTFTHLILEGGV